MPSRTIWTGLAASQIGSAKPGQHLLSVVPAQPEIRRGGSFRCSYTGTTPVLLELPVLYYPCVLEVQDNGHDVLFGNAGHFVAVPLQAGSHEIEVWFVGAHWANVLGSIGWGGVAIGFILTTAKNCTGVFQRLGRLLRGSFSTPFSVGSAFFSFTVLAGVMLIARNNPNLLPWNPPRLLISASSMLDPGTGPDKAFDGSDDTAWISADPLTAVIHVGFQQKKVLRQIELQPRLTSLHEGWHHVRVVLQSAGKTIFSQDYDYPNAAHQSVELIAIPAVMADHADLYFSEPVTEKIDGTHVSVESVRPGYSEIRFTWDK